MRQPAVLTVTYPGGLGGMSLVHGDRLKAPPAPPTVFGRKESVRVGHYRYLNLSVLNQPP
jgi:hypothetical protein